METGHYTCMATLYSGAFHKQECCTISVTEPLECFLNYNYHGFEDSLLHSCVQVRIQYWFDFLCETKEVCIMYITLGYLYLFIITMVLFILHMLNT